MIRVSDNAATNVLISRLGMGRIDALARKIGLHHTTLRRKMMDFGAKARGEENTTSASDMVVLMGEIRGGTLLSPVASSLALKLLLDQRPTSRLPIMLPAGALYAHKTGQLEGVENDVGIVLMPDRTFALAVFAGRRWSRGWARVVRDRGHPVPLGRFVVGGSRVRVDLLEAGN